MKKAEIKLNAVRKLLGLKFNFEAQTLADGTSIQVEPSVEEGATVVVITADGEEVAAPDGEHALADGRVIVTADGVIIQVIEAPAEDGMGKDEDEDKFAALTETIAKLAAEVATLRDRQDAFEKNKPEPVAPAVSEDEFKAVASRLEKAETDLASANEVIVKLADQSKDRPAKQPKRSTPPSAGDVNEIFKKALFPNAK